MRRSRPSVLAMLACLASASLFASASCSDDVPAAEPVTHDAGADGSALSDGAPPPDGHAGSGTAGSGAGGRGGASSGGATDAQVGMPSGGAASGGRGSVSGGTGGTVGTCDPAASQDGAAPEPLSLCDRLQGAPALSFDVTRAYERAVYADCRVAWVTDLYLDRKVDMRAQFLNTLLQWNMKLWGCTAPAAEDFALIFKRVPLTAGDAAALVEAYVQVATELLELSPAEITELRATVGYLARPLIEDPTCGLSHSRCVVDAGPDGSSGSGGSAGSGGFGAGGAAGAGGTSGAGSGGVPPGAGGAGGMADDGGATNPVRDASSTADGALDASTGADASTGGAPN